MKRLVTVISCTLVGAALVAGLVSSLGSATGAPTDDSSNIRKHCESFLEAWKKHDAKAMAANFAEDGDMIGPDGRVQSGRAEIEKHIAEDHGASGPMRESRVELKDEPIRFVTSDVAVSDATAVLYDSYGPDGKKSGPLTLHVTNVWKKVGNEWLIFASRPYVRGPAAIGDK